MLTVVSTAPCSHRRCRAHGLVVAVGEWLMGASGGAVPAAHPETGLFLTGDQDQQRSSQGGGGLAHCAAPRLTRQLHTGAEPLPSLPRLACRPLAPEVERGTPLAGGWLPG